MPEEPLPRLDPKEAIAFFRAKGWQIAFSWLDVWQEENARAFTVAKAMSRDLLEDIRAGVDAALAEGTTLQQFIKDLRPRLASRGWWGRKWMTDPDTGERRVVQLGSPARLRTIYETNLRTSYMAGRWQRIEKSKAMLPYIRYVSVMDGRERPEHHAWHGTVLPVDDPWWDTHFPPCGWHCRCDAQPVNQRTIDRRGWTIGDQRQFPVRDYVNKRTGEVTRVELGIDPGFGYNVGKASLDPLTPAPRTGKGDSDRALGALSEADFARVRGFFAAFGLTTAEAARMGKVWKDAAGWPLAISAGLLRAADGSMLRLARADAARLERAARVLTEPDSIALVWVAAKDGRQLLVRRYRSALGTVDMGRDFWRWGGRGGSVGLPIWTREDGDLAAYNPHQARHGKGSRDGGKFRSTGRGAAMASLSGGLETFRTALLGSVGPKAAATAASAGIDISGRGMKLEHSAGVHIVKRHGRLSRDKRKITEKEIMSAPGLLERAFQIKAGSRLDRGMPTIVARLRGDDGARLTIVAGVSGKNLLIKTMHAKKRK